MFEAHQDDISFSEKDLYKGQLFTSPYTKSKFYSEIKVLEAVNEGLGSDYKIRKSDKCFYRTIKYEKFNN